MTDEAKPEGKERWEERAEESHALAVRVHESGIEANAVLVRERETAIVERQETREYRAKALVREDEQHAMNKESHAKWIAEVESVHAHRQAIDARGERSLEIEERTARALERIATVLDERLRMGR